jgi:hypothetical protein
MDRNTELGYELARSASALVPVPPPPPTQMDGFSGQKIEKGSVQAAIITEDYETYRAARIRFHEIKQLIKQGELLFEQAS